MKKIVLSAIVMLFLSSLSFAVTLIQKSETTPEFTLSGHVWNRYTVEYLGEVPVANQLSINRNYISMKLNGEDFNSNVTLDIINKTGAQVFGDYQLWIKLGYIEFTKIPLLTDFGITLRSGIQLMYTGTNPIWKYNLYEVPVEGKAGLSSADMGIALLGSALDKKISYEAAIYSGDGYAKLDTNMLKALCTNIKVNVIDGLDVILTYYKRNGITSRSTESTDLAVSEAVVTYSNGMLTESYVAFIEALGPRAAGKTGVKQIVSGYAGVKLTDWVSVFARVDVENPDTGIERDENNQYYAGLVFPVAKKAVLLLDYSLKHNRIQAAPAVNNNTFVAQIKWDW